VTYELRIESRTCSHVVALASVVFTVHALLPRTAQLPFFAALSLAALVVTLGMRDGIWLVGGGTPLIGACHVPARVGVHVAILGAALADARVATSEGITATQAQPISRC
jgi:hypothetical protein